MILEVKKIYAPVMSESAIRAYAENGISLNMILESKTNRTGMKICPMEEIGELFAPTEHYKQLAGVNGTEIVQHIKEDVIISDAY